MALHLGVSGSVRGCTEAQRKVLGGYIMACDVLHHGDCVGVDAEAHDIALSLGKTILIHPLSDYKKRAFKDGYGPWPGMYSKEVGIRESKPYMKRNQDIARESEIVVGFPHEGFERLRSGTFATLRHALKAGKQVYWVTQSGKVIPFTKSKFIA